MGHIITIMFIAAIIVGAVVKVWADCGGGKGKGAQLKGYGYAVKDGQVYRYGTAVGSFAGSQATVTDGTSRHTLTRVVTVAGAFTKKSNASLLVAFPSGTVHEKKLNSAGGDPPRTVLGHPLQRPCGSHWGPSARNPRTG